jgi:hypothetical protein
MRRCPVVDARPAKAHVVRILASFHFSAFERARHPVLTKVNTTMECSNRCDTLQRQRSLAKSLCVAREDDPSYTESSLA